MATWHQMKNPVKLYSPTKWNVVIDPPNQMTAIYSADTKDLADVYLQNLKANNPGAAQHAYILPPRKD